MSADTLFTNYQRTRFQYAKKLTEGDNIIDILKEMIITDNDCRRSMGSGEYRSPYSCKKCTEISRVASMREGDVKTFEIEAGRKSGENMIVLKDESPLVKIELDERAKTRYHQLEKLVGICRDDDGYRESVNDKVEQFIAVGTWLNGVVMSYLVEYLLVRKNIPHCLPVETGFICNRVGYLIRSNERKLVDFEASLYPDGCRTILQQIAVMLKVLSRYSFIHGSATIDRLYVDSFNDCNYTYDNHSIIGDFTIKVAEYHYSSMTLNNTRIFPHTLGRSVNVEESISSFSPVVERIGAMLYDINDDTLIKGGATLFKINSDSPTLFTTMRYSGYPLFGGAYDMYSFFISLMSWEPFANVVNNDEGLSNLWNGIFPDPDEVPKIPTSSEGITCSYRIGQYLQGRWLYCDLISRLLERIEGMISFASDSE
jgi:hypothetical protein